MWIIRMYARVITLNAFCLSWFTYDPSIDTDALMFERVIVMILCMKNVKILSQISPYKHSKTRNFSAEFFTKARKKIMRL